MTQLFIYKDKAELLTQANSAAESAEAPFKNATRLYFVVRYFTAVHESQHGEILIQVWNEYRNALDHFFRYQSNIRAEKAEHQLKKMEGHIQRAAFDILKLNCHKTLDTIQTIKSEYPRATLSLVDNGDFLPWLNREHSKVSALFRLAKVSDHALGASDNLDNKVLESYLDAATQAHKLMYELDQKSPAIENAIRTREVIGNEGKNLSYTQSLILNSIVAAVFLVIGLFMPNINNSSLDDTGTAQSSETLENQNTFITPPKEEQQTQIHKEPTIVNQDSL